MATDVLVFSPTMEAFHNGVHCGRVCFGFDERDRRLDELWFMVEFDSFDGRSTHEVPIFSVKPANFRYLDEVFTKIAESYLEWDRFNNATVPFGEED